MAQRRVLFFGSFDLGPGYPRAASLAQALESRGIEVSMLRRELLPSGEARRALAQSPLRWPRAGLGVWSGGRKLVRDLRHLLRDQRFDAILVPYPGHFAVKLARRCFDGPVILDLFLSLADTIVGDRKMFRERGFVDHCLRRVDRRACAQADLVLVDTPQNQEFLAAQTGLAPEHFGFVPVGVPYAPSTVQPMPPLGDRDPLRALYLGTGVPLHGVRTILGAVARTSGMVTSFVGGTEADRREVASLGAVKVPRIETWVDEADLPSLFAEHHVVFGVFGPGEKVARVVPLKVVHALACGRPVVTAETPAVTTLLEPGGDCFTVPRRSPAALARALRGLIAEPRVLARVGRAARKRYETGFSPEAIGRRLVGELEALTGSAWGDGGAAPATELEAPAFPEPRRSTELEKAGP